MGLLSHPHGPVSLAREGAGGGPLKDLLHRQDVSPATPPPAARRRFADAPATATRSRSRMAEADARAARASQFLAKLSQSAELATLARGPYTRVVDSCISYTASVRRGNAAVAELSYIGPLAGAPDPPPAGGAYASIEHLLGEANGDLLNQRFSSYFDSWLEPLLHM